MRPAAGNVRSIARAAGAAGIDCQVRDLGPAASANRIRSEIAALSASPETDGVIL